MKILLSVNRYPTPQQPFTAFISVLAEEMTRQGHEITVVAPQNILYILKKNIGLLPYCSEYSVDVNGVRKYIKVYRPKTFLLDRGFFRKWSCKLAQMAIVKTCSKLPKPDVCYGHFWASSYNIYPYAVKHGIPLFTASGEDRIALQNIVCKSEIAALSQVNKGTICVSTKNKEESVSLGLAGADRCIVLPNSVDPSLFRIRDKQQMRKELGMPYDAFIIAFVGRFNHRKGVMRLSEAIKKLDDESIKVLFIGATVEGAKLIPDCDGILYMGPLLHNDIPKYLSAADVYVMPTQAEGCSNSIVEALACGLPVVSSRLPFNFDILNEENSIMVDPDNIDEIATAIKTIKQSSLLRERLREGAIRSAKGLSINQRVNSIIDFIKQYR